MLNISGYGELSSDMFNMNTYKNKIYKTDI